MISAGRVLFESDAIIEYLDEIAPDPPLLPGNPELRAAARAAGRYHDGRVEPTIRALFPLIGRRPVDRSAFANAATQLRDRLERLCEAFEPSPFIAGEQLSIGDLGYPGTLMMAELLLAEGGAAISMPPALAVWRRRLMDLAVVGETVGGMQAALQAWIAEKTESAA